MKLLEAIELVANSSGGEVEEVVYATRVEGTWGGDAPATVLEEPIYIPEGYTRPQAPEGMEYFLEGSLIREVIEVYQNCSGKPTLNSEEKLKPVIFYAEYDAFLPVGDCK